MTEIFGIPLQALYGQLLLGLVNGSFYALLSLGLAVIFGLLGIVNFAHGALYMMGAYAAWIMLERFGINYWFALVLSPLIIGIVGVVIERLLLKRLYKLDPVYGLLLTFGLALIAEGVFRDQFGVSGQSYSVPDALQGATDIGFMVLPNYRAWVVLASLVVCFATWFTIEKTSLGATLRAATENAALVQAFGVNVPVMVMLTYGAGAALAALAGVLAAPIIQVTPLMGSNLIIVVFAVVVIGGMGSILGSILTGLLLGLIEGLTRAGILAGAASLPFDAILGPGNAASSLINVLVGPVASNVVVFMIMIVVLIFRPLGLFGKGA